MKLPKSTLQLLLVVFAFTAFAGYSYMSAATTWTAPVGAPPANNVDAPINVGVSDQVKNAGLSVNALLVTGNVLVTGATATFNQVRAREYCDELGNNCFTHNDITSLPSCAAGEILISQGRGGWTCGDRVAPPPPLVWLVNNKHTESECLSYGGSVQTDAGDKFCRINARSCPLGWTKFKNWDAYSAKSSFPCGNGNQCYAPAQSWANTTNVPSDSVWCGSNADMNHSSTQYCYAQVSDIGCY